MKTTILFSLIAGVLAAGSLAGEETLFNYKVGDFDVTLMVENRSQGRSSILIGADPGMVEKYMPGGVYSSEVNVALIRGGGRIILVDTGFGAAVFDNLAKLGVAPAQVDTVLLTHMHGDHIGGLQKDGRALFPNALIYVAEQERAYWIDQARHAGSIAALAPYANRVVTFSPGEPDRAGTVIFPGILALAAFGHTPGHTVFLVESGGKKLLIWGDLVHAMDIQIPFPGVSVIYDSSPEEAAAVRRRYLEYAAANNIPVAGMHLLFPAVGEIRRGSNEPGGAYSFVPAR